MDEHYGIVEILPPALEWAPTKPSFFFNSGTPNAEELASQLVSGANFLGSGDASLYRLNEWFIVASASDWFAEASNALSEQQLFTNMRDFPEAGQNSIRPEFVAAAFCKSVVVLGPDGAHVVRGEVEAGNPILEHLSQSPTWRRAVAFRGIGDA